MTDKEQVGFLAYCLRDLLGETPETNLVLNAKYCVVQQLLLLRYGYEQFGDTLEKELQRITTERDKRNMDPREWSKNTL
jgi:hypothetical protein